MTSNANSLPEVATAGPLVVSKANSRYFAVASGSAAERRAVYPTGSHINNNFHDGAGPGADCAETPERFELLEYIQFLKDHGHNFIRMWRWEQFKSQVQGGFFHLCMSPQPLPRTGPGNGLDGKPKFDLSKFDEAFFERLRDYVITAGKQGIYVSVMLFDGRLAIERRYFHDEHNQAKNYKHTSRTAGGRTARSLRGPCRAS